MYLFDKSQTKINFQIKVDCEGTIDECTKQYCPNMFRWSHNDDSCHPIKGNNHKKLKNKGLSNFPKKYLT